MTTRDVWLRTARGADAIVLLLGTIALGPERSSAPDAAFGSR
jgi:hypothetical protein